MSSGDFIRAIRKGRGLTQKELGERLGLSPQSIAQWENGLRKPKRESIEKIAAALGVDAIELLDGKEKEREIQKQKEFLEVIKSGDSKKIEQLFNLPSGAVMPLTEEEQEEVDKVIQEQKRLDFRLRIAFHKLNMKGRKVALERVEELSKIKEYSSE